MFSKFTRRRPVWTATPERRTNSRAALFPRQTFQSGAVCIVNGAKKRH
jgi:hypothetical protein